MYFYLFDRVMEICKSLDVLDTLLDEYEYEDCFSKRPDPNKPDITPGKIWRGNPE